MTFDNVYCFSEIVIFGMLDKKYHMRDTKVLVLNSMEGTESVCGVLDRLSQENEEQRYTIPCDLKCGDEVKLTVQHDITYISKGCIRMREVQAYQSILEKSGERISHICGNL